MSKEADEVTFWKSSRSETRSKVVLGTFSPCPLSASWPVQDFEGDGHLGMRNSDDGDVAAGPPFFIRSDINSMPRLKDEERAFHVSSVIRECVLSLFNFLRCFASRSCELKAFTEHDETRFNGSQCCNDKMLKIPFVIFLAWVVFQAS
jgi:hypothetical protein